MGNRKYSLRTIKLAYLIRVEMFVYKVYGWRKGILLVAACYE